jgi:hypothetical protein
MPPLWPDPTWEKIDSAQELSPLATEGPCLRLGLHIRNQAANKFLNHEALRLIDCYPSRRERHAGIARIHQAEEKISTSKSSPFLANLGRHSPYNKGRWGS